MQLAICLRVANLRGPTLDQKARRNRYDININSEIIVTARWGSLRVTPIFPVSFDNSTQGNLKHGVQGMFSQCRSDER